MGVCGCRDEWIDGGLLGGWVDECVNEGTSENA